MTLVTPEPMLPLMVTTPVPVPLLVMTPLLLPVPVMFTGPEMLMAPVLLAKTVRFWAPVQCPDKVNVPLPVEVKLFKLALSGMVVEVTEKGLVPCCVMALMPLPIGPERVLNDVLPAVAPTFEIVPV